MKNKVRLAWRIAVSLSVLVLAVYFGTDLFSAEAQEQAVTEPRKPKENRFEKFRRADEVTGLMRSPSKELVRVKIKDAGDGARVLKFGKIVQDYGSFVVLAKDKRTDLRNSNLESQPLETSINLPNGRFEPLQNPPAETIRPDAESAPLAAGKGYYIVQFGSVATDEWLKSLEDAGAEILQYVPHQAFFVYADTDAIGKIAAHSRVRWVGRLMPEHKISPELESFTARVEKETAMFDVAVFKRANLSEVRNALENSSNGRVLTEMKLPNNYFNVLRIEIPVADVAEIAKIADVVRIDQYEKPQAEDERAAQIVAGNYSSPTVLSAPGYNPLTQFGVDGTGVTVSVVDDGVSIPGNGGFYITSTNTVDGPLRGATAGADGGHGHINASIIAGSTPFGALDPTGYNYGVGVAPKANIINIPFLKSGNTTTDAQAVEDTLLTSGVNGVKGFISNNSWGNGLNSNSYDSYAAMYDGFVQDGSTAATIDPITLVFSAGNSGPGALSLTRPKVAKNLISVANSENVRTELGGTGADNMEDLRNSSSRGPASDGRIKPDITAPGTVITGSRAGNCSSVTSCFDTNHAYSTGTSHAAPQVAGAAALFTQFWKSNNGGVNPSPALIKAAIINTAQEMSGNVTSTSTIPNGNEGWGRIYLKNMFNTGVSMKHVNETVAFSNPGENVVYSGTVSNASKPFRVSLVWTDPPGTGNPALVNNLDLTVTVGANTYRGNVFSNGNSTTGGASNTIDNVENVFLPAGLAAGTPVTITVNAAALNGNGILGNADATDQHFALVAYNFAEEQTPASKPPVDFDGDSRTDISIFRPAAGEWWYVRSSDSQNVALQFGQSTDKIIPADFTGDGKADIALFRPASNTWYVLRSENGTFYSFPFGAAGDIPIAGDFDGDGTADPTVFRPSTATWFSQLSTGGVSIRPFGTTGDVPVPADFDGDGLTDLAIFRPSAGEWWINRSGSTVVAFQFGSATDKLVTGDYTGDGLADAAFYRPSTNFWFVLRSEDSSFYAAPFGAAGDVAAPGDYDGDGRFDFAVFRPSNSTWFIQRSTSGTQIQPFGAAGDIPVPSAFVP